MNTTIKKKFICNKSINGLTYGREYDIIGAAGDFVVVIDDNGQTTTVFDVWFE